MTLPTATRVGTEIRRLRKAQGMSQVVLSQRLGMGWSTLSGYERGDLIPSLARCRQLDAALGLTAGTLEGLARLDVSDRAIAQWNKEL